MGTLSVSVAMSALIPILKLDLSCTQAAAWVIECLTQANLSVIRTFNMQWLPSEDDSQVEDAGQEADVGHRVIILLVRQGSAWATLLLFGEDGHTWVSISKPSATPENINLAALIQSALQSEIEVQSNG
ncbi:hypothetical protein [Thermanaerothrix sp.]|uniref:hypothetical protein n=1 Tax=Thermanaerothrix sp. TaxID=2972675 RepID=UPI002ADE849B|nr:hypothetical protein [Thermanaerothrix sp.]